MDERYKIIEDDQEDEMDKYNNRVFSPQMIKHRYEQSDLVIILLKLAYIPDSIVKGIADFKAGWSDRFKADMDLYNQNNFQGWLSKLESLKSQHEAQEVIKKFNEELEDSYKAFIEERKKEDQVHIQAM